MSTPRTVPPIVTERQAAASNPDYSAWVSANAGSGKTHVLAQRVIRLLLKGEEPARILCITFTKAAAANMANKVFADLRAWTMLDDAALDEAMRAVGVKKIDANLRMRARRLFALALETPGGLKVQTIHAFCTQLLHLFPFEANVPARFEVLDDITETQMLGELTLRVLLEAAEMPDSPLGRALAAAVLAAADITFQDMVREAIGERDALTKWIESAGGVTQAIVQLSQTLNVGADETVDTIDQALIADSAIAASEWGAIADALDRGSKTDQQQAARFRALASLKGSDLIETYLDIFCTKARDKTKDRVATTTVQRAAPQLCDRLAAERDRVWALVGRRRAIEARDRSAALFTVAHAAIERFRDEKNRRGLIDYDDLIDKTLDLLKDERGAWVHYKLDRGIHHILIDEAQDTSPKQWEIVKALVAEFFAGAGAHEHPRTVFAVGDEKQSIFSFQGAAPLEFATSRRHFELMHERAGLTFVAAEFKHSFRSGANVLGGVDAVFERPEAFAGLSTDKAAPSHEALPDAAPGLVEIWELEKPDVLDKKPGWAAPFDTQTATSGTVKLARRIARTVAAWRAQGRKPKEVLVLVRQRRALFEAIICALKVAKLPVAGADRLVLTEHIAVMDLMALAEAVLLPQDDLALATVLKSPLFGLDDAALFDLAWNRVGSLHATLRGTNAALAAEFDAIRAEACGRSPFAFYARLLGARKGRRKILARLGHEANDALDEFLNLALDYERIETPSLQGFIAWLRAARAEVKRDMEMERDEVRVMTVHGAKGLEAPIVILAETTTPPQGWHPPRLLHLPPGKPVPDAAEPLLWATGKTNDVGPMAAARETALDRARDEYRRLLYVAMTRAAERLVVCGTQGEKKIPDGCWYQLVSDALKDQCVAEPADDGDGEVWRYRKVDDETAPKATKQENSKPASIVPPDWLDRIVQPDPPPIPLIRPSTAVEEDTIFAGGGENRAIALQRGRLMHRLLQSLPDVDAKDRAAAAARYMARAAQMLPEDERSTLAARALDLIAAPEFAALFGSGSRAEVPIVGNITVRGKAARVSGQVDRLAVTAKEVLIADYKTGRVPESRIAPKPYAGQLAGYREVLKKLYPDKTIRALLIWTETPESMEVSESALDAALTQVTSA